MRNILSSKLKIHFKYDVKVREKKSRKSKIFSSTFSGFNRRSKRFGQRKTQSLSNVERQWFSREETDDWPGPRAKTSFSRTFETRRQRNENSTFFDSIEIRSFPFVQFLVSQHKMDYSLLIGIHDLDQGGTGSWKLFVRRFSKWNFFFRTRGSRIDDGNEYLGLFWKRFFRWFR